MYIENWSLLSAESDVSNSSHDFSESWLVLGLLDHGGTNVLECFDGSLSRFVQVFHVADCFMDEVAQGDDLSWVHEFRFDHQVVDVGVQNVHQQVQVFFFSHAGVRHLERLTQQVHNFVSMLLEVAIVQVRRKGRSLTLHVFLKKLVRVADGIRDECFKIITTEAGQSVESCDD
jgi:hypothetical protein